MRVPQTTAGTNLLELARFGIIVTVRMASKNNCVMTQEMKGDASGVTSNYQESRRRRK